MALRHEEGDHIPKWEETQMKRRCLYDLGGGRNGWTQASNSWKLQGQDGIWLRVERLVVGRVKEEGQKRFEGIGKKTMVADGVHSFKGRELEPWKRHWPSSWGRSLAQCLEDMPAREGCQDRQTKVEPFLQFWPWCFAWDQGSCSQHGACHSAVTLHIYGTSMVSPIPEQKRRNGRPALRWEYWEWSRCKCSSRCLKTLLWTLRTLLCCRSPWIKESLELGLFLQYQASASALTLWSSLSSFSSVGKEYTVESTFKSLYNLTKWEFY